MSKKTALAALFVSSLIWGACPPIFKLALTNIPPFSLAYLRFFIALIILLPFCYKKLAIERSDFIKVFLIGFFGITINISFFFLGLNLSDAINSAVIGGAAPVFTIIGALLFFRKKTKSFIILGAILSSFGVLTIIIEPLLLKNSQSSILGNLFFVGATLGAVFDTLIAKSVVKKYSALTITFWSFLTGTVTFSFPALFETFKNPSWIINIDKLGILGIFYGSIFASLGAYFLWYYGLEKIPAQEVSLFYNINPVVSVLIAVPLLGEKITIPFVIGTIMIFFGIAIAERKLQLLPIKTD